MRLRRLFRPRQSILVAVSGGLDSMVLLDLLKAFSGTLGWRLTVAHLNHCLRGRSSDADESFVCRAAAGFGLPAVSERADVRRFSREHGISLEMAARRLRHEFLARTALRLSISAIALAHHADDQLELFFLRLLRGSGAEGLAGMKWSSPSPLNPRIKLFRPLLDLSKSDLREYASKHKVRFREDETNSRLHIRRNRIRHELLPLLRSHYQPALDKIVLRTMEVLGAEAEEVGQQARLALKRIHAKSTANTSGFAQLPVAVQRRCVQIQLLGLGLTPDYELIEQLRTVPGQLITTTPPERQTLGGVKKELFENEFEPVFVARDPSGLLRVAPAKNRSFQGDALEIEIGAEAGEATFAGAHLMWSLKPAGQGFKVRKKNRPTSRLIFKPIRGREVFDAERVGSRVQLRHWRPGDRFQPIGMASPVKLQDFFTNQKIPSDLRRQLIVAATALGDVFWVQGMRISERFKLTKHSIRCLHWRWQRH